MFRLGVVAGLCVYGWSVAGRVGGCGLFGFGLLGLLGLGAVPQYGTGQHGFRGSLTSLHCAGRLGYTEHL